MGYGSDNGLIQSCLIRPADYCYLEGKIKERINLFIRQVSQYHIYAHSICFFICVSIS